MTYHSNIRFLIGLMNEEAKAICNETADDIVPGSQELCPKDKGALAAGIYAIKEGDNPEAAYAEAVRRAREKNPKVEVEAPLGVQNFSLEGEHQAAVGVVVNYAPFVHNGYSSHAGRPFLEEAGQDKRAAFDGRMSNLGHTLEEH